MNGGWSLCLPTSWFEMRYSRKFVVCDETPLSNTSMFLDSCRVGDHVSGSQRMTEPMTTQYNSCFVEMEECHILRSK